MAISLNALASQIMADISSNLNIRTDLNREHVYDAIFQVAASLIRAYQLKGMQLTRAAFCTSVPRLQVQVADFTQGALLVGEHVYQDPYAEARAFGLPVEQLRQFVRLPYVMTWGSSGGLGEPAIDYLGPLNNALKLDVCTGEDYHYMSARRYGGRRPFAWVVENVAWLFSPTPIPWQEMTMRAVLDDQREMAEFGRIFDIDETRLNWPLDFTDEVAKALTNRYISMYGRALPKAQSSDGNLPQL